LEQRARDCSGIGIAPEGAEGEDTLRRRHIAQCARWVFVGVALEQRERARRVACGSRHLDLAKDRCFLEILGFEEPS
jgi:hypothetical protein